MGMTLMTSRTRIEEAPSDSYIGEFCFLDPIFTGGWLGHGYEGFVQKLQPVVHRRKVGYSSSKIERIKRSAPFRACSHGSSEQ